MHKTLYVDVDEEITSIIDRIRAEQAAEIFLVVPKEAMLTHGVINLKLIKKEIDKIDKSVMIATNDANAKKVIERLGIKTKEITGDIERENESPQPKIKQEMKDKAISEKATDEVIDKVGETAPKTKKQMDIGSDNFFDGSSAQSFSTEIDESLDQEKKQNQGTPGQFQVDAQKHAAADEGTSPNMFHPEQLKRELYAKKRAEALRKKQTLQPSMSPHAVPLTMQPQTQQASAQKRKISVSSRDSRNKDLFGNYQEEKHNIPTRNGFGFGKASSEKKAEKFFSRSNPLEKEQKTIRKEVKKEQKSKKTSLRWKIAMPVLILIVGLGATGMWMYANYPKVQIAIHLKKESISKEIKIIAKEGASRDNLDEGVIPGRYIELTVEKSMEFDTTGETFESDDGKARGKVTIYNRFSSSSQPLVATTRVLSKDGKLFRLIDGVTVPGMSGEEPGTIEADVISDEPGEDYNIAASTFTIEGFKGNPKYEKFEVVSKSTMTDGGNPDSNKKLSMVTEQDLDAARKKTIEALEETLEQDVSKQIDKNMRIIIDSVEKEIVAVESSQKAKDIAKKFTYTVTQKVKAIMFDNEDVNFLAIKELEKDVDSGYLMDSVSQAVFKKGIADLEEKSITMYIDAEAIIWPSIDKENIINGIVGKKEEEMKAFLVNYPEIEKVESTTIPSWLTTIPVSRDKVEMIEIR